MRKFVKSFRSGGVLDPPLPDQIVPYIAEESKVRKEQQAWCD
ncbi:hypothetical protein [Geobacter grbiciae]|nr:hypothetical protein [Geobacter grbiciae]